MQAKFPFEVSEDEFKGIITYLGELPAKYANPLIQALTEMSMKASKVEATDA